MIGNFLFGNFYIVRNHLGLSESLYFQFKITSLDSISVKGEPLTEKLSIAHIVSKEKLSDNDLDLLMDKVATHMVSIYRLSSKTSIIKSEAVDLRYVYLTKAKDIIQEVLMNTPVEIYGIDGLTDYCSKNKYSYRKVYKTKTIRK